METATIRPNQVQYIVLLGVQKTYHAYTFMKNSVQESFSSLSTEEPISYGTFVSLHPEDAQDASNIWVTCHSPSERKEASI